MNSLRITDNKLLSTSNVLWEHKEFHIQCGSHILSSLDREMLIFHKREIKTKQFKDLGSKMTVFAAYPLAIDTAQSLDQESFYKALSIFTAFDENTGEYKAFLPHYRLDKVRTLHKNLQLLHQIGLINKLSIDNDMYISGLQDIKDTTIISQEWLMNKELSYLYGLALTWWHWQTNSNSLTTIKINIPLFGQFTHHETTLNNMSKELAIHGLFIDIYKKTTDTIECVISDYDVLAQLALWYNPIANFDKISKKDLAQSLQESLVQYLKNNKFSSEDVELVRKAHIKLLTVN